MSIIVLPTAEDLAAVIAENISEQLKEQNLPDDTFDNLGDGESIICMTEKFPVLNLVQIADAIIKRLDDKIQA